MVTYTCINKSSWYSTNSTYSFRRHESRWKKGERGRGAPVIAQGRAAHDEKGVDVERSSIVELTLLRAEEDEDVEVLMSEYQEYVDTSHKEAEVC